MAAADLGAEALGAFLPSGLDLTVGTGITPG